MLKEEQENIEEQKLKQVSKPATSRASNVVERTLKWQ
jgi:hypothetical protein